MSSTPGSRAQGEWSTLSRLALVTGASVLLIFAGYEIVERTWLQDLTMERLHVLHRVRGLTSALVAGLLMSWLILRRSPALFPAIGVRPPAGRSPNEAERVAHYARWFIGMRWIALITATVLVLFTVWVVELLPRQSGIPLLATIGALALLNTAYAISFRSGRGKAWLLPVQAYGDLLGLTVLLHYSGGVENPLGTLMLLHVIIGGIILTRRQCYLVAAAGSTLFALLVWAEWAHVVPHYTLRIFPHVPAGLQLAHAAHEASFALSGAAVQTAILFLTAYFATTMAERLRRNERQLELFAERIAEQTQLLERALEMTGTGLCLCDAQLESTWCNGRWQSWFPGACGDANLCAGVAAPDGSVPARETLRDGRVRTTEVTLGPSESGPAGPAILQLTTAPLLDNDGVTTHVAQLGKDVTEQKRVQSGMLRAERLAAVGELAGKVAHEVNNPIAVISAKARLLAADEPLSSRAVEELGKIAELSDRVARIAQGLLSYGRPPAGPDRPVDVAIPLRKALAVVEAPAALAGITIEERLPAGLPHVRVNASEMEQVFLNLFLNALDAMPAGGRLVLEAALADGGPGSPSLEVTVEDTGAGIPEHLLSRVFEPFVTTKEEGRGTGLGLSICLGLVRSNGGEIDLDSAPGRGTRVRLRFPTLAAEPEALVHA